MPHPEAEVGARSHPADRRILPQATRALEALVMLLRFQGVAADPAQIKHRLGGGDRNSGNAGCRRRVWPQGAPMRRSGGSPSGTRYAGIAPLRDGGFLPTRKSVRAAAGCYSVGRTRRRLPEKVGHRSGRRSLSETWVVLNEKARVSSSVRRRYFRWYSRMAQDRRLGIYGEDNRVPVTAQGPPSDAIRPSQYWRPQIYGAVHRNLGGTWFVLTAAHCVMDPHGAKHRSRCTTSIFSPPFAGRCDRGPLNGQVPALSQGL